MQAGIFWFNLMGKQHTILWGQGWGGREKKSWCQKRSLPPAGGKGKERMVLWNEIYKIKIIKSPMTSKAEWDLSIELVAFCTSVSWDDFLQHSTCSLNGFSFVKIFYKNHNQKIEIWSFLNSNNVFMGQYKPSQTQTLSTETMCLQSMQGHYCSMTGYCEVKAQKSMFIIHFIHIIDFLAT